MRARLYARLFALAILLVAVIVVLGFVSRLGEKTSFEHTLPIWDELTSAEAVAFRFPGPMKPRSRFHRVQVESTRSISPHNCIFPFQVVINGTSPTAGPYDFLVQRINEPLFWEFQISLTTTEYFQIGPFRFNSTTRYDTWTSPTLAPRDLMAAKQYEESRGGKIPKNFR